MNEAEKQEIRQKYIQIRKQIKGKSEKSKVIINKVKDNKIYKESKVVALYKSLASEVDTTELIDYSLKTNKIVVLPKTIGDELKFYKINSLKDSLIKSNFGIEEPIEKEENLVDISDIDLFIVPGVCFDREKNRLGFGKGYYDRLLSGINKRIIGICFSEQIIENRLLPVSNNDVKMEQLITDIDTL